MGLTPDDARYLRAALRDAGIVCAGALLGLALGWVGVLVALGLVLLAYAVNGA